jgi:hypothetical protein
VYISHLSETGFCGKISAIRSPGFQHYIKVRSAPGGWELRYRLLRWFELAGEHTVEGRFSSLVGGFVSESYLSQWLWGKRRGVVLES